MTFAAKTPNYRNPENMHARRLATSSRAAQVETQSCRKYHTGPRVRGRIMLCVRSRVMTVSRCGDHGAENKRVVGPSDVKNTRSKTKKTCMGRVTHRFRWAAARFKYLVSKRFFQRVGSAAFGRHRSNRIWRATGLYLLNISQYYVKHNKSKITLIHTFIIASVKIIFLCFELLNIKKLVISLINIVSNLFWTFLIIPIVLFITNTILSKLKKKKILFFFF